MERVLRGVAGLARRRWFWPAAVVVACLGAYLPAGRSGGSGDTLPARLVAFSLLREGDFDLDEFAFAHDEGAVARFPQLGGVPYYLRKVGDHTYSAYTVAPTVLALPVLAPFVLAGVDPASPLAAFAEKLAASLIVALSAAALFCLLRGRLSLRWALFLTAVYAFGTSSFATSSQALWQHGPGQLCLSLALLWMAPASGRSRPVLSALALGAAVAMRNTNALAALPLGLWLVWRHREAWWRLALAAAAAPGLLLAYYLHTFGAPGPVAESFHMGLASGFRQIPLPEGLWGVTISPMRGLFFHSPVFLLALAGGGIAVRKREPLFAMAFLGALAVVPLVSKWIVWWGGHCFGPRLLADTMPLWALALVPAVSLPRWPGRLLRRIAVALGSLSIGIGTLGAVLYDGRHDAYAFTDLEYGNMLRGGGGPTVFYATELMAAAGLRRGPPTDLGPPPVDPNVVKDGKRLPRLIHPSDREPFLRTALSSPVRPREEPPEIGIRFWDARLSPGDRFEAEIRTLNPGRPHAVNGWVVIRDASGGLWNLHGARFTRVGADELRPWSGCSPLPYDVDIRIENALPGLPPGRHELFFALTDCANTRVESRAGAVFEITP